MKVKHPCVIEYLAAFQTDNCQWRSICIVMEYAPLGDLGDVIRRARAGLYHETAPWLHHEPPQATTSSLAETSRPADRLATAQIRSWLVQVASGLQHIHSLNVLHRDLASKNILLSEQGRCKISDFGISHQLAEARGQTAEFCGTPFYMSPQVLMGLPYGMPADVWSLGVVAFQLLTLALPFPATELHQLPSMVHGADPQNEAMMSQALSSCGHPASITELVSRQALLNTDPERRMSLSTLLECLRAGTCDVPTSSASPPTAEQQQTAGTPGATPVEALDQAPVMGQHVMPSNRAALSKPPLPQSRSRRQSDTGGMTSVKRIL